MLNKKTNYVSLFNIILLSLYFFIILFFAIKDDSSAMSLNRNNLKNFNEGWTVSYNNIVDENAVLPQKYNIDPLREYSIERVITKKDFSFSTLLIRSSMMNINAYIDNQLIFTLDVSSKYNNLNLPYPASWQLIEIPVENAINKTLKITFSSSTSHFSGLINPIMLGNGEALIFHILGKNKVNLVISVMIIILSLFSISTLFWLNETGNPKHIIYLALFGIASSLWIISESTLLQLFTSNQFLISSTSYILNLGLPLIIILFFRDIVFEGFYKLFTIISTLIIALLFVELYLQFTNKMFFITSTLLSIIMIAICSCLIIICLIYEGYKKNNSKAKHYFLIFLALFIVAAIIMGLFISGVYQNLEKYLSLGVFGFFLLVMSDMIKSINNLIEARNKSVMYKQLAYEDYLTKGNNRAAFEKDVEQLIEQKKVFRLVLLDLNHLKQINDTYGHSEGDYAIIESYNSLNETIKNTGKSYRISGDEFACILYDISEDIFENYSKHLTQDLKDKSKDKPYDIVLAIGSKIYNEAENFTLFYKKVDVEMYKHKNHLKSSVETF